MSEHYPTWAKVVSVLVLWPVAAVFCCYVGLQYLIGAFCELVGGSDE